jgi:hypothetical protein
VCFRGGKAPTRRNLLVGAASLLSFVMVALSEMAIDLVMQREGESNYFPESRLTRRPIGRRMRRALPLLVHRTWYLRERT